MKTVRQKVVPARQLAGRRCAQEDAVCFADFTYPPAQPARGQPSRGNQSINMTSPAAIGEDTMQPLRRKLFLESLTSGPRPVPADWRQRLEAIVEAIPHNVTIDELIESVADVTPDRCRTLIEAVENEVDVMEDAMNEVVQDHLRHYKAQQKAQLRSLEEATKASQEAAYAAQQRLYRLVPNFDWGSYYSNPDYLKSVSIRQGKSENPQDGTQALVHCKALKRLLERFIDQVNERVAKMQRDLSCGVLMSVNEEMARVQKENAVCRSLYNYLKNTSYETSHRGAPR